MFNDWNKAIIVFVNMLLNIPTYLKTVRNYTLDIGYCKCIFKWFDSYIFSFQSMQCILDYLMTVYTFLMISINV